MRAGERVLSLETEVATRAPVSLALSKYSIIGIRFPNKKKQNNVFIYKFKVYNNFVVYFVV